MKRVHAKRNEGFTLIELMIVVAIIGILAAIAIPNFLRFQLKARSSEGKVNVAAIRTAEVAYQSEFGTYVAAATTPAALTADGSKQPFIIPTPGQDFDILGWAPEGQVYFVYTVVTGGPATGGSTHFTASAHADIDASTVAQAWGYVKEDPAAPGGGVVGNTLAGATCAASGVFNPITNSPDLLDTVGPCNSLSGQSEF